MESSRTGAVVTFSGIVRDHNDGKNVRALEYEAYAPLCETEAQKIFDEAIAKFDILSLACLHRTGKLNVGDTAVWIGVGAAHRDAAFEACRYVIDEVKKRLPIWKKEYYSDGDSGWVNCTHDTCGSHISVTKSTNSFT